MNTLIVIESLTIVNLLNKVQFPFVKVFPPQMLSSSSEGAIVQAVPIAFAPVIMRLYRSFSPLLQLLSLAHRVAMAFTSEIEIKFTAY